MGDAEPKREGNLGEPPPLPRNVSLSLPWKIHLTGGVSESRLLEDPPVSRGNKDGGGPCVCDLRKAGYPGAEAGDGNSFPGISRHLAARTSSCFPPTVFIVRSSPSCLNTNQTT